MLTRLWTSLFTTKRSTQRKSVAGIEQLETRQMLTVAQLWFDNQTLVVKTDNSPTSVSIQPSGTNLVISEIGTTRTWSYPTSKVGTIQFQGGAGNDSFINLVPNLPSQAFGFGGNDDLEGNSGNDYLQGGDGNDILKGFAGNDTLFGDAGDDLLLGMTGDDQLMGGDGNDHLNGGAGTDSMWGQNGDDILIAIDGGTSDFLQGDAGRDTFWMDQSGSVKDRTSGTTTEDKLQLVSSFTNGADRTLDGDRITDPTVGDTGNVYRSFSNKPLFSQTGPSPTDIRQGDIGDCWLLSGLAAIAHDSPTTLRQNVVDFDDGTYGVKLGTKFYRIDNDLAVVSSSNSTLADAGLGADSSMWVAIVEKAFAYYRTGANSYGSLEGGWSIEVNRAFGSTTAGEHEISTYSSATALANDIATHFANRDAVTIGFINGRTTGATTGLPLIMGHMYVVMNVIKNSTGVVTSIVLRNPWGYDGAGNDSNPNDGLVTLTPSQLFGLNGRVNWGRVA